MSAMHAGRKGVFNERFASWSIAASSDVFLSLTNLLYRNSENSRDLVISRSMSEELEL